MKKYIPLSLKRIPWWLVKSPQRKFGYALTFGVELGGFLWWLLHLIKNIFYKKEEKISICTGILNRTDNYLNYVFESVLKMQNQELIELSIYDCGSDDVEKLESEIRKKWNGNLVFTKGERRNFERSFTFNKAIRQSTSNIIFTCDADMSLPTDFVQQISKFVSGKTVWFPICFNLNKDKPTTINSENGKWYPDGMGMVGANKFAFEKAGGYDESYKTWGGEDWEIWEAFYKSGYLPLRNKCKGLFHQYHPTLKPKVWVKNMPNIEAREREF
ncbi:MAG: glycosyltransferase family 2 protein [Bacteroidetes bacterium]|nr:glycosyltransferase family 2 protein [Bacteroidota bacterium]